MIMMELKMIEEFKNELLNRKEYIFQVSHPGDASPSRDKLRKELTEKFGKNFIIKKVKSRFGFGRSKVMVEVYESKEDLEEIAPTYLLERDGIIGE